MYSVERYHDFSAGHRVVGHESKCQYLHGHNYRVHFTCAPDSHPSTPLDDVGRVIDFGVIKERLCMWLEECWDHKMLLWRTGDPFYTQFAGAHGMGQEFFDSVVPVPFNPTAENMARYLVETVGPLQLKGTGVVLHSVTIEETRKCSATYTREY